MSGMLEQLPNLDQVTAESLQAALIGMLHSLKSEEHHKQMEQLNRQGGGKVLGLSFHLQDMGNRSAKRQGNIHPPDGPSKHSS